MSGRKLRVPTVYQMTATECGAASLGMVLSYFGRDVPLQTLREQCGIGRDGATAKGIINGAQAEGLVAELHQTSATSAADLQTPFIAYWQHRHFLVVEGHDRRGWHLNDPARGRYTVSDEQWATGYSNYAIKLSPGPDFQRTREGNRSFFRELLWPMKGSWGPLVVVIATGVLLLVPAVALPTIAGVFIDDIVIAQNGRLLMPIIFALVLIGIYSAIMRLLDAWTMLHLSIPLHARLNASVLWRMLRLPTDFFTMRPVGGLMGRIGKAGALADVSMHSFPKLLLSSLTMLVMFAAVLWRSPLLALIAVISAVVTVASLLLVSRMRRETAQRIQATKFELSGKAMSGLRDMDSLKAQGASTQYLDSFMDTQAELLDTSQRLRRISAYYAVVPGTVSTLTNMALLIFGALEVMAGNLTVGAVVACLMLTKRFLAPVGSFLGVGQQLQTTHATVSQLNDVMQTPVDADFVDPVQPAGRSPASTAKAATEPAPVRSTTGSDTRTRSEAPTLTLATTGLTGQVSLSEVTFGYSQQHAVLNDITVDIPAGAKVGIVGRSGSGKSTLGNLICGVIHPDSGAVTFDGVDRLALPRALLTTSIAKVNQPPMLFEGTVDDNVRLWDPSIPPEAVEGALVDAQCERFVGPRGGPSARVLAEGRNFSGGQVQRLEIARALARNPAILILDEATSALDRTTESAIDAAVEARGCTRIIIAHRLSTIETCDVIYVLDKGRITESGTYAQLVAGGGLFSSLVAAQR